MKTAAVLLSFNRPNYLRQVLTSIKNQTLYDDVPLHIFQDGAVNKFSGNRYAEDKDIKESIRVIKELAPEATLHISEKNIGILLNFKRAEDLLYRDMEYDQLFFFEDDLVLNPEYYEVLFQMLDKYRDYDIGTVDATGHHCESHLSQEQNSSLVIPAGHQWGYALTRDKWEIREQYMQWYYDIMLEMDYRQRPNNLIFQIEKERNYNKTVSGIDGAKECSYAEANLGRIKTFTTHARYIGVEGLHFREHIYNKFGFNKTVLYTGGVPDLTTDPEIIKEVSANYLKAIKIKS